MTFEEWFHKEYEPSDLQIKQYAKRKEGLHIPAELYLEDIQKAYEAGQKDSETQIEKMKCCENCKRYKPCVTCNETIGNNCDYYSGGNVCDKWEIKEND